MCCLPPRTALLCFLILSGTAISLSPNRLVGAQETAPAADAQADVALRFNFESAPWKDVIQWLAEQSDLALHVSDLPTGSLTYSDPRAFSQQEAIDRINLFLLSQGYTLVRSGRLLSVINLGDPRSLQQLDVLAKMVTVDQLDQLSDHEVVKCIFALGEIRAEDAAEELATLKLMTAPAIFSKTNRLMVTESVGKLKSVRTILEAFEPSALDNGTMMKNFTLRHADAEDILVVARPHLGLATGEMIGIDVSLSADLQGRNIFVTGVEDKVKLIESLITELDKPTGGVQEGEQPAELKSHPVSGGNVETVYNVLLTLLADRQVRLSVDEEANAIVALATADIHREISQTVEQLQATEADFEVIPLKTVDPYFAIGLLDEMLDLPDPLLDDPEDINPDAPKIDADPGNRRLFVRAKRADIERIKKIVAEIDEAQAAGDLDETMRLLPLKGPAALRALETAARFWRAPNPIVYYAGTATESPSTVERVVGDETEPPPAAPAVPVEPRVLGGNVRSSAPLIRCQVTPRGVLLQSDDAAALESFYRHLQSILGPTDALPSPPVVFYLKYSKADDALRILSELLDGGEAASEGEGGSLVNAYVDSWGASRLSFLSTRAGTTTLTSETLTVVADSRLNRLIAQGTAADIELIENYLKIVDKESSITSIETHGRSRVIELEHSRATEVAAMLRDAYAGRVAEASPKAGAVPGGPQPPQQQRNASPASENQRNQSRSREPDENRGVQRRGNEQGVRDLEIKFTIAVHEPSNSLIVTAPERLFEEIKQLAEVIDSRSQQTTHIMPTTNGTELQTKLQQILSGAAGTSTAPRSTSPTRPPVRPTPRGSTR